MRAFILVYNYVCVCACECFGMHSYICRCMCLSVYFVRMCVCLCVCVCVRIWVHAFVNERVSLCAKVHSCVCEVVSAMHVFTWICVKNFVKDYTSSSVQGCYIVYMFANFVVCARVD